jgi:hypothetical protein
MSSVYVTQLLTCSRLLALNADVDPPRDLHGLEAAQV